ncbi:hypothetical protein JVU11DRAFT_949 [Chiua virens]|nr:hypothetical protein JVU11DRAFT_949 [Chiua virens]
MPPKRKRRPSPAPKGLAAGEHLKRAKLAAGDSSAWGWVDTEVSDPSQLTLEHRLMTCGLSRRNKNPTTVANGELENDVIVVSDDEPPPCNKKACKNNPNCLNYLGQLQWEDEEMAREQFIKTSDLCSNPILNSRDPELPVGLKNLGATCYANAFLQVWFRDLAFRRGVYQCQPSQDTENSFEESPIFQLQVMFAALQESIQNVYNPERFAESLKLSTSEQQDAQEFSKLFMSHLDQEFQKQLTPSLQTLISNQFQGGLVYGTRCHNCRYRSERSSDFLELEINIENNARLEDRIAVLLQNEKLSGDNKYSCPNCASLRDATRYTELRSLPPVLHFSLLRFVYDFDSMERKKSKHNLLFPMVLDMSKFVKTDKGVGGVERKEDAPTSLYELRGVLLHKGQSAYHGHYVAQVLDTASKTWFQFDDEVVTEIDFLGEKRHANKEVVDVVNDSGAAKKSTGQPRARSAKKRRIDDSDDELVELPSSTEGKVSLPGKAEGDVFSSRDAYMLIYARKGEEPTTLGHAATPNLVGDTLDPNSSPTFINGASRPGGGSQSTSDPTVLVPPQRARDVVKTLNASHDEACELYARREKEVKERFAELREWMRSVYTHWHVASVEEDAVVVSKQALEKWLSKPFVKPEENKSRSQSVSGDAEVEVLPIPDIICHHGGLDPTKASNMKRMSRQAYEMLSLQEDIGPVYGESHGHLPTSELTLATERLYQIQHPRLVVQFDEICDVQQWGAGLLDIQRLAERYFRLFHHHQFAPFNVSPNRVTCVGWRAQKPRMHVPLHGDPSPDSAEFRGHVRCEHDQLSLVSTARRSISSQACEILKKLFPDWKPLSTNQEPCPVCEAVIYNSKEDKRELRKKAEDEKARLRHMHDNALIGNTLLLENIPCAVLPADFVRIWRKWLSRPAEVPRPDRVDTSPLFCQHDRLVFDPNAPNDWDSDVTLIQMSEWLILQELYNCGRVVAVEKKSVEDSVGVLDAKFVHDTPVCHECRLKRRRDYNLTDITVRFLASKPVAGGEHDEGPQRGSQPTKQESGLRATGGTRQSKRIRQGRDRQEYTQLRISKSTTVKDIKIQLHTSLKIPTICQRLFYKDQELLDNTVTVESLGILMNDTLDLREEAENEDNLLNSPDGRASKRRKEEKGFGGTLLATSTSYASLSADTGTSSEGEGHEPAKPCPACTFANPVDSLVCTMCKQKMDMV